jgi:rhodanese-related sulfurtransferase
MSEKIDIDGLVVALRQGARLIDVREPDEYVEARVPGAELIPLATLPGAADRLAQHEDTLYVICRSGVRSVQAVDYLSARGIDALSVSGGTMAWIQRGLDYETGED